jgi:hypothetical protein
LEQTLPVLQKHLDGAKDLEKSKTHAKGMKGEEITALVLVTVS